MRIFSTGAALLAIAVVAVGCGSATKPAARTTTTATRTATATVETTTTERKDAEETHSKCRTSATSKPTGLPSGFPTPSGFTATRVHQAGPTVEVDGYVTAGLDTALSRYGTAVARSGYTVLHKEHDPHDAEINYKGSSREGQIALKDNCTEPNTTRIHITNRPT
jgi:hypothetical protein